MFKSKKKLDIAINSIELKKVNFKYFGSKENVLSDINLEFKKIIQNVDTVYFIWNYKK